MAWISSALKWIVEFITSINRKKTTDEVKLPPKDNPAEKLAADGNNVIGGIEEPDEN